MAYDCITRYIQSVYTNVKHINRIDHKNRYFCRAITPRLKIYVSFDGSSYHAIYLHANTTKELMQKLGRLPGFTKYAASMDGSNKGGENGNSYANWCK